LIIDYQKSPITENRGRRLPIAHLKTINRQ
jgi:hypothetical protein